MKEDNLAYLAARDVYRCYVRQRRWLKNFNLRRASSVWLSDRRNRKHAQPVTVNQPLILVAQVQRSGGTLMSQLFDDHPECHAHPSEIMIGYPKKFQWPDLDLARMSASRMFADLREDFCAEYIWKGYSKLPKHSTSEREFFPFVFNTRLQKALFLSLVEDTSPKTQREVLACYMTSYFNAWIDYQDLYRPGKKYVTGFTPRVNMFPGSADRFFADYPDGYMVSIIRNPVGWFASASRHVPRKYGDVEAGIELWLQSVRSSLELKKRHGDRVILLAFEGLVSDTETTMRRLCEIAGLTYYETLTMPTFNSMPIRADSVFSVAKKGVVRDSIDRSNQVDTKSREFLESKAMPLYHEGIQACMNRDCVSR